MNDTMTNTLGHLKSIAYILLLLVATLYAQNGTSDQWGGVTDIFDYPVGARAMAMGGAQVSVSDDAFSLYWNPASLEMVPAMSLGAYHTNLPMETQYSYFSFTYPTLSTGTFSVGILRLATGNIELRDVNASYIGSEDYGRSLYMFGYGKKITGWLSIGANLKIENMRIPGYQDEENGIDVYSESSVGGDIGVLLLSGSESGFFKNWRFGINAQNLVQRSIQFEEEREFSPRMYRFGLSRLFYMNDEENYLNAAFEYDINENQHVPDYLHLGMEYCYQDILLLRLGWNRRGNYSEGYGMTYGFGIRQFGIQLDYSYWGGRDAFGSSHRISATLSLGKTRKERIAEIQEREMRRIQEEAIQQRRKERREAIYSGLSQARQYYEDGDYPRAYSAINKVLAYDESGDAPEFEEARQLAQKINDAINQEREEELEKEIEQKQADQERRQRERMVKEHYEKALAFYEQEQYYEAIEECDEALNYNPNSSLVKDLREKATEDLKNRIVELVEQAHRIEKEGRIDNALDLYRQALPLSRGIKKWESLIKEKIRQLEGRLSYDSKLRRAAEYEMDREWGKAAQLYQEAMRIAPNNELLKQKYNEAKARSNARRMDMTPQVREIYLKGYSEMTNKNYEEAIIYFRQALDLQPHNVNLWGALDYARSELRKKRAAGEE